MTAAPAPTVVLPFFSQTGVASFYGAAHHGKTTADGGTFDRTALTAAHSTLAFGTVVRVTNLSNGRMVKVEINDRGPRAKGRIIDLSVAAARMLGMEKSGIARVRLEAFRADQPMEN
jgi:rare lipoprotein A